MFLVLFLIPYAYALEIAEFLPNPIGDDASPMPDGEYIELYNPSDIKIDLEGYYFLDAAQNKLIISSNNTEENTFIDSTALKVIYRNANTKFSLNNDKDQISLYDKQGNVLDSVSYNQTKENYSNSKIDNIWILSAPTPGKQNYIEKAVTQENQTNKDCLYNLQIKTSKEVFQDSKIDFIISIERVSGVESQILLQRSIKNKTGDVIKKYEDLTLYIPNKKELEYTPSIKDSGIYQIFSKIKALNCTNKPEDSTTKTFELILNQNIQTSSKNSSITIIKIDPKEIKFGDYINIRANIKKYNTQKNLITISLYDKDNKLVTKQAKINLFDKDYEIELEFPYYLKDYCISGNYLISIEGLDKKAQKEIHVNNASSCDPKQIIKTDQDKIKYESNLNSYIPENKPVYQSVKQKSKDYAVILFIFVLILIIIKLLRKK